MDSNRYDLERIKRCIDNYKYVSFDIFDTLIKRNVSRPVDVFEIVACEYERLYKVKINGFKNARILAEKKSRTLIFDIEKIKKIELNIELDMCQQNKEFYKIYEYCVTKGKKIIITSDMYLKREYIEQILFNANINTYEKLFLSNEVKLNKHSGNIYPYILKELNIEANQIIHIGDSKKADFVKPILKGIKALLIQREINRLSYYNKYNLREDELLNYNILQSFINNNIDLNQNKYYNIGYEILGSLLYGYSKWLLESLKRKNIKKVFFLAREGNLLKKAFDLLNDSDVESEYIYISRRSVRPALLQDINNLEDLYSVVKIKDTTDVKKFLKDVGLDIEGYLEVFEKYNYSATTKIKSISNMEEIFELLKEDIKNVSFKEKKNILGYLKSKNFNTNVAISDVGWAGTMQKSLQKIFKDYKIMGFYMATTNESSDKYAYLSSYENIRPFVHLFENLFLAQHGTTLKYKLNDGEYEPVLDEYEYSDEEMKDIIELQEGALNFIRDISSSNVNKYLIMSPIVFSLNIVRLGLYPTRNDVEIFENMPYIETVKMKLIEHKRMIVYITNLKRFKEDFFNSGWKIGFLKRVFKINLPYFKIYNFLLKCKE